MKTSAIKKLVENYTMEQLAEAERAIVTDQDLPIMVDGCDESEKFTHLLAAVYVLERMKTERLEFREALKAYSRQVRESIN